MSNQSWAEQKIQSGKGDNVTTLQAVIFGMMLSWTPSMVLLAYCLWKEKIGIEEMTPRRDLTQNSDLQIKDNLRSLS
jgi:hypothetical protein